MPSDVDEAQAELPRDRAGHVGLAHSRWPVQQDAVPLDAVALGIVRMLQHQPDRLPHLLLQPLHTAHVRERDLVLRGLHLELAAAVARHATHAASEQAGWTRSRRRAPLAAARARSLPWRIDGVRARRRLRFDVGDVDPLARRLVVGVRPGHALLEQVLEHAAERHHPEWRHRLGAVVPPLGRLRLHPLVGSLLRLSHAPAKEPRQPNADDDRDEQELHERAVPRCRCS